VGEFFEERLGRWRAGGVSAEQLILDPGIGFGKTCEHNLELLARVGHFSTHQRPLLIGASRKMFIGEVTGAGESTARLAGSLACACAAVAAGAQIIRTHDVAATRQALLMTEAIQARKK
jgi:dihydropteroate synthase